MNNLTTKEQFKFSNTGLQITGQPTFKEWQETGTYLKFVEGAVQWWIGDWLNYGEARWGEMYTQALNETDFKQSTLHNLKYVAGKIESSRRKETLKYSHHVEVVSLDPGQQDELLDLAEQQDLTVRELRQKVKAVKIVNGENDNDEYQRIINIIINYIAILKENYPVGLDEIKTHLESSS